MRDETVPRLSYPDPVVPTNYDRLIAVAMSGSVALSGEGTLRVFNATKVPESAVVYVDGSVLSHIIEAPNNVKHFTTGPEVSRGLSTSVLSVPPKPTHRWKFEPLSRSIARLPEGDRERYAEEWSADLDSIEGRFARWRWQLGIRLAARRLAKPAHAKTQTRLSNS